MELGISAARVLTRDELIDEIVSAVVVDEQERSVARGFLGRARDLITRVMEKGLHLPDAAQRILSPSPPRPEEAPKPIATVALAAVYAKQGHRSQALCILEEVLAADPDHAAARALQNELGLSTHAEPMAGTCDSLPSDPRTTGKEPEHQSADASSMPDETGIPHRDELSISLGVGQLILCWKVRPITLARWRGKMPSGRLSLRVVHTMVRKGAPKVVVEDHFVDRLVGSMTVSVPDSALSSHAAVGWRYGDLFMVVSTTQS